MRTTSVFLTATSLTCRNFQLTDHSAQRFPEAGSVSGIFSLSIFELSWIFLYDAFWFFNYEREWTVSPISLFHSKISKPSPSSPHSAISLPALFPCTKLFSHSMLFPKFKAICSVISSFSLNLKLLSPAWQRMVWNLTSHWPEERNMQLQHIYRTASFFKEIKSWTEVVKREPRFFWTTPKYQKHFSWGTSLPQGLQWHLTAP